MHPGIRTTLGQTAVLLAVLTAVAGCGSDDSGATATDAASDSADASASASSETSATPSPSESASATPSLPSTTDATEAVVLPACSSTWVVGQKLPRPYQGCTDDAGAVVQADGTYCEFGKPLFTYAKRFYAVENGPINQVASTLAKDKTYQQAVRTCGG